MDTRSYSIAYRSRAYEDIKSLDDLLTALFDLHTSISEQCRLRQYHKVKKNFDPKEKSIKIKHETAIPLLQELDSCASELIETLPNVEDHAVLENIYRREKRGRKLPETPLNNLATKLSNLKSVIDYLYAKYPLAIQRVLFYENHRLYISNSNYISFKAGSDPDILLSILFKKPTRKWKTPELKKRLLKIKPRPRQIDRGVSFGNPVKIAVDRINKKFGEKYNDPNNDKIIFYSKDLIEINPSLLHFSMRIIRP